jgi:hypothetical protein
MPPETVDVVEVLLPIVVAGWACRMVFRVLGWANR